MRGSTLGFVAATAAAAATLLPAGAIRAAAPAAEAALPSCVEGSPPLPLPPSAERALLDAGDRQRFHDAAQARYPLYARGGQVPLQVALLRQGGRWQYVTLQARREGGGPCVAAVFSAERFEFTAGWLDKYRPAALEGAAAAAPGSAP